MAAIDKEKLGEYLSAYLDDELSDRERSAVEALAARDPGVRRQLEQMRQTVELVRGLPHRAAPPSLLEDLTATAERDQLLGTPGEAVVIRMPWWRSLRPMLSAAAVLVIAVGGGFYVFNNMGLTGDRSTPSATEAVVEGSSRSPAPAAPVAEGLDKPRAAALADGRVRPEEKPSSAALMDDVSPSPVDEAEETRVAFAGRTEKLGVVPEGKAESVVRGLADPYAAKKHTQPAAPPTTDLWAQLTLEQKSNVGVKQADLLDHSFANENNVLTVVTDDAVDAALARQQVVNYFVSNSFRDVELLDADAKLPANQRLYYQGRPGVNYERVDGNEVIVQLPAAEIRGLVAALAANDTRSRGQQLALGPVVVQGGDEIQRVAARIQPRPPYRPWVVRDDLGERRAKDEPAGPGPVARHGGAARARTPGVMLPMGAGGTEPASESAGEAGGAAAMRAKRDIESEPVDADDDAVVAAGGRGGGRSPERSERRGDDELKKLIMKVPPMRAAKEEATEAVGDERRPRRSAPEKPGRLVQRNRMQLETERRDRTAHGATVATPPRTPDGVESAEQFITLVVQFVQRPDMTPADAGRPDDGGRP
ncbi:MAG: hypothetical protein GY778_07740 [bacterium]|nr:hypothetical protein [bacterium]